MPKPKEVPKLMTIMTCPWRQKRLTTLVMTMTEGSRYLNW